jgi:ABC-type multidrug transport system fused ATPase/permease subunit
MPRHFRVFLSYFIPQTPYFILGMLCIFLSGFLQLYSITLIGKLIDSSISRETTHIPDGLNSLVFRILLFMVLQVVFSAIQQYCFLRMNEAAIASIRKTLYSRYLRYSLVFFNKEKVGDLISRINNDIGMVQYIFCEQLPAFLYQSVILMAAIGTLLQMNLKLTLLMIVVFPLTVLMTLYIGKKMRTISKQIQDAFAVSVVYMEETLQKIRTVKAFSSERAESRKYNSLLDSIVRKSIRRSVFKLGLDGVSGILMIFGQILIIWYGSSLVERGELTVGKMITFMMITFSVGAAVSSIAGAFGNLQKSFGSTQRLHELLSIETEEEDRQETFTLCFSEKFHFDNISFSYADDMEDLILSDLSFEIQKGERIGIVGPSGVGKSTIAKLFMRFYHVTSGAIYLDGSDIRTLPLAPYRRLFGVVSQEIELFGSTVRENICYGKPLATDEEMREAAVRAHAYEFITELPHGFDTVLGENGYTLSGGQRQRLAIARALLTDPQVLILDEATSALDSNTELIITETLEELMRDRTTIVVSHRLTTIRRMDRILVFHGGKIVESGTHEYLMKISGGKYRELNLIYDGEGGNNLHLLTN